MIKTPYLLTFNLMAHHGAVVLPDENVRSTYVQNMFVQQISRGGGFFYLSTCDDALSFERFLDLSKKFYRTQDIQYISFEEGGGVTYNPFYRKGVDEALVIFEVILEVSGVSAERVPFWKDILRNVFLDLLKQDQAVTFQSIYEILSEDNSIGENNLLLWVRQQFISFFGEGEDDACLNQEYAEICAYLSCFLEEDLSSILNQKGSDICFSDDIQENSLFYISLPELKDDEFLQLFEAVLYKDMAMAVASEDLQLSLPMLVIVPTPILDTAQNVLLGASENKKIFSQEIFSESPACNEKFYYTIRQLQAEGESLSLVSALKQHMQTVVLGKSLVPLVVESCDKSTVVYFDLSKK